MISQQRLLRLRQRLGLSQLEMARRLGMSASYLNLIEHGRRPVTRKVESRLAAAFESELKALSKGNDGSLAAALVEAFTDPLLAARAISPADVHGLAEASPDLGRAILELYRAYSDVRDKLDDLREELRERELATEIGHEFRNLLASIRSFAEILRDNPDLPADQRQRFLGIVVSDTHRLLPLVGGLFDGDGSARGSAGPGVPFAGDDVADFFHAHAGYFVDLEDAVDALRQRAGLGSPCDTGALVIALAATHGVSIETTPGRDGERVDAWYDPDRRRLVVPGVLSQEARRLELARCLADLSGGEAIERYLADARFAPGALAEAGRRALRDYFADAILMPYESFLASARELRHDIERLRRRFGVDFEHVCRRLTTLQRPGARGIPFHLLRVDIAGNVTWRFSASGMRIARFSGVCSLWNVHAAFLSPGTVRPQVSRMPDGKTYFSIARTIGGGPPTPPRSPRLMAIELGCEASFASEVVYADGLAIDDARATVLVGSACRLCERADCPQRVLPPFRSIVRAGAAAGAAA